MGGEAVDRWERIFEIIDKSTVHRVIDIGCHRGEHIQTILRPQFPQAEIVGVEPKNVNFKECLELDLGNKVSFLQLDCRQLSGRQLGHFDLVWCTGLINHLDDPTALMKAIGSITHDGSYVLVEGHVAIAREQARMVFPNPPIIDKVLDGHVYQGKVYSEHVESLTGKERDKLDRSSLNNPWSFWLTVDSILAMMRRYGFRRIVELRSSSSPIGPLHFYPAVDPIHELSRRAFLALPANLQASIEEPGTDTVETVGYIDKAHVEAGAIVIQGWVAGAGVGPVDALTLWLGGERSSVHEIALGLESSDVANTYRHLVDSQNAHFQIRVPCEEGKETRFKDKLVTVTPWIRGKPGRVLVSVCSPSLPQPGKENLEFVGGRSVVIGYEFLGHMVQRGGLQPSHDVLDVGCGTGRIAYALAYYLDQTARYEGFDVASEMIRWAQESITPHRPNFTFRHVDIYNAHYNPSGTVTGRDFVFPYSDESFHFVLLASVFTHMRGGEVRHYMEEIRRVLRPAGRCLVTLFAIDEESRRLLEAGRSSLDFVHEREDGFAVDPNLPEGAIAFEENRFLTWLDEAGLELCAKYPGRWPGRPEYASYQDILILARR